MSRTNSMGIPQMEIRRNVLPLSCLGIKLITPVSGNRKYSLLTSAISFQYKLPILGINLEIVSILASETIILILYIG